MKKVGLGESLNDDDQKAFNDLKAQYEETKKLCDSMSKTFNERLEEAKKTNKELGIEKVDIEKPHLIVLNEDPQLSHKLKYSLKELPIYVGRKHGNPTPKIKLSGIGIKQNHAIFVQGDKPNEIILKPNESDAIKYIYINGKKLKSQDGQILKNRDRIIFGTNTIMIYMEKSDGKDIYDIDWECAQTEFQQELEKQKKNRRRRK
jgi:kinesin family protein 1